MATYTSNYAWTKPEGGDPVDITVLNGNLDSQDNIVHNAYMQLAPVFSTASTYAVDDVVLYANNLYKCITAVTVAGAWDATKWTQVKVSDIAGGGGGGGGTTDYLDLTNKPQINGVTLTGNKATSDFGLVNTFQGTIAEWNQLTTAEKKAYDHASIPDSLDGNVTFPASKVMLNNGGSVEDMFFAPDYARYVLITINDSYSVNEDGYIIVIRMVATGAGALMAINGANVIVYNNSSGGEVGSVVFPVKAGDTVVTQYLSSTSNISFAPVRK